MFDDSEQARAGLDRQAVDWVQRLASGQGHATDVAAARRWRDQSPAHRAAFARASRVWQQFAPAARNLRARGDVPAVLPVQPSAMARRAFIGGGLAAASATMAVAAVHPPLDLWPSLAELSADYRTGTGEQRMVALRDDLSVRMNAQTSLRMRSPEAGADSIELIAGQASFAIAAPSPRRLIVRAAGGSVSATRGRFDIQWVDQTLRVTCLEGGVQVQCGPETVQIGAGRQASYGNGRFDAPAPVDIDVVTAWERGVLVFRMTPLAEVVREINRYRPGRVILLDRELARRTVSGRFRIDHIEDILLRLNQAFGLRSRALPGGVVLLT